MTAVDVDALDKLLEAHEEWTTNGLDVDTTNGEVWNSLFRRPRWMDEDDVRRLVALHNAIPDLLAEVRRGRALQEAVEALHVPESMEGTTYCAYDGLVWPCMEHRAIAAVDAS